MIDKDSIILRVELDLAQKARAYAAHWFDERIGNLDAIVKEELERFDFEAEVRDAVRRRLREIAQHQAQKIAWAKERVLAAEFEKQLAAAGGSAP